MVKFCFAGISYPDSYKGPSAPPKLQILPSAIVIPAGVEMPGSLVTPSCPPKTTPVSSLTSPSVDNCSPPLLKNVSSLPTNGKNLPQQKPSSVNVTAGIVSSKSQTSASLESGIEHISEERSDIVLTDHVSEQDKLPLMVNRSQPENRQTGGSVDKSTLRATSLSKSAVSEVGSNLKHSSQEDIDLRVHGKKSIDSLTMNVTSSPVGSSEVNNVSLNPSVEAVVDFNQSSDSLVSVNTKLKPETATSGSTKTIETVSDKCSLVLPIKVCNALKGKRIDVVLPKAYSGSRPPLTTEKGTN